MKLSHFPGIAFAAATVFLTGCAGTGLVPPVPEDLQPPDGQTLTLKAQGVGVQIYLCKAAADDAAHFEWTLQGPQADLFDAAAKRIGKHYAGPTWEALDGSTVVGEVKARDSGPNQDAVDWLLLAAKSNSGSGVFSTVQWVQRLQTKGGKASQEGCGGAGDAGTQLVMPYSATYYFYSPEPPTPALPSREGRGR
jgi:hypothetical protein